MTTIIAGGFDVYSKTQLALQRLREAGVAEENLCEFRVNPAGEHDRTIVGGDRAESPGSRHADAGATKGAAIGAAVGVAAGIAATPLVGPAAIVAGAGVGGYTGSLVGGMKETESEHSPDHSEVRPAEAMIAVNVGAGTIAADDVVRIFEECGAHQVERAEGTWSDGQWADFDPVRPPQLIGGKDLREHRANP
ncbi:MAG TPA: hypothetical protein VFK48_16175 [Usitatibacter sp.]|nr:hypothetical protein [Usitatibacter sp.]